MTTPRRLFALIAAVVALLALVAMLDFREKRSGTEIAAPNPPTPEVEATTASPSPMGVIPKEELRSALTDACTDAASDPNDRQWSQQDGQDQIDALNTMKLSLSERLSVSSSVEHLHLAAVLENDPVSRIDLLERAISVSPSDPFLLWGALQICYESRDAASCPMQDWEQRLIAIDGQNSESWIRVAANRYAAGEHDEALEAMRHAATAAESRAYWTETIEMIERGIAAAGDYAFPERAFMAFGIAASVPPRYGDYVTMCKEQSARSVDWAYSCLAYGELVENQGKTEMGVAIARSIQILALDALGELEKAAELRQLLRTSQEERLDSIWEYNSVTERLIFSNPTLFSAYLAAVKSQGEVEARRQIATEIERMREQDPELACERF